jgi:hypothetical protein
MVEDIRSRLNYNYRIIAKKFGNMSINAERFGTDQILYDTAERNVKTLEDLLLITRELKKDRQYALIDSYMQNNVLVKLESQIEIVIRHIKERGMGAVELDPLFIRKAKYIFDIYEEAACHGTT